MPYLSKNNRAAFQGITSPWANRLAFHVARLFSPGVKYPTDKPHKHYLAVTRLEDDDTLRMIIFFQPSFCDMRLSFGSAEFLISDWRSVCRGYVRCTITRNGLVITDHNATIRGAVAAQEGLDDGQLTEARISELLRDGEFARPEPALN